VARAEAYLHAKFHLDPSNRLATIHQRYRQTVQTDRQRSDSIWANRFTSGRPISQHGQKSVSRSKILFPSIALTTFSPSALGALECSVACSVIALDSGNSVITRGNFKYRWQKPRRKSLGFLFRHALSVN